MFAFLRKLAGKSDAAEPATIVVPEVVAQVMPEVTSEPEIASSPPEASQEEPVIPETKPAVLVSFPPGHFYSPIVDPATLIEKQDAIWSTNKPVLGIDFNDANHVRILTEIFPRFIANYNYVDDLPETGELTEYFTNNSQFGWLDSRTLLVLLQHLRPRRIVEIGSGFSSLLTADVNNRLLQNSARFSCIEPYPREFLQKPLPGLHELLIQKVEDLAISYFAELGTGDILFIDSSHVAKTGSDVNYLVFEILPRLQPGVIVHIHDIFLPREYPREWVLDDNRSWNEQYLIRALLMYSTAFKIYFSSTYAFAQYPELVAAALRREGKAYGGSSLWLERI